MVSNLLLWLLSAVNEVRTTRREQNTEEKIQREGKKVMKKKRFLAGTYCITSVFNKRLSSIDLSVGNFSKHPAELKGQWDPCAGLIEDFLF